MKAGATATLSASSSSSLTSKGKGKGKESLNEMSRSASQRNILDAIQATDSIDSMRVTGGTGRWFQCLQQRKRGTGNTYGLDAVGDAGSITPEGESDDEHEPHMRRGFHPAGGATPVSPVRLTLAYELARERHPHKPWWVRGQATGEQVEAEGVNAHGRAHG